MRGQEACVTKSSFSFSTRVPPTPGARYHAMEERANLMNMMKLSIKILIQSALSLGRTLDSDFPPLQQFFVVLEHCLKHGLKGGHLLPHGCAGCHAEGRQTNELVSRLTVSPIWLLCDLDINCVHRVMLIGITDRTVWLLSHIPCVLCLLNCRGIFSAPFSLTC